MSLVRNLQWHYQETLGELTSACLQSLLQPAPNAHDGDTSTARQQHTQGENAETADKALLSALLGPELESKLAACRTQTDAVAAQLQSIAQSADTKRQPLLHTAAACAEQLKPLQAQRAALAAQLAQVQHIHIPMELTST